MERKFTFEPGEYYHLYNRGVDKHKIFFSDGDWNHFQKLLFFRNDPKINVKSSRLGTRNLADATREDTLVDICAYALMPNHFHILVREKSDNGISRFMSKLQTSFSKYMNIKYDRSGPLMCRPYRARHVSDDDYLRWLISYIHLNSLETVEPKWREKGIQGWEKAKSHISNYKFSSYHDYFVADRDETHILTKEALPFYIDDLEDLQNMWNTYNTEPVN